MPITWNEARELDAKLQRDREEAEKRRREWESLPILTRFPVGSKARITRAFDDERAWGDTVTITADCSFDIGEGNTPAVCADHEVYGDCGFIFTAEELEPLP